MFSRKETLCGCFFVLGLLSVGMAFSVVDFVLWQVAGKLDDVL